MSAARKLEELHDEYIKVTRCMGREVLERACIAENRLTYTLFQNQCVIDEQTTALCFGISVECSLFGEKEYDVISDITTKFNVAKKLFDLMVDNMVTPVSFRDIVEDYLVSLYSFSND